MPSAMRWAVIELKDGLASIAAISDSSHSSSTRHSTSTQIDDRGDGEDAGTVEDHPKDTGVMIRCAESLGNEDVHVEGAVAATLLEHPWVLVLEKNFTKHEEEGEDVAALVVLAREALWTLCGSEIATWASSVAKVRAVMKFIIEEARLDGRTWFAREVLLAAKDFESSIMCTPNLVDYPSDVEHELETLEEVADILEQIREPANDTLDEADLCLPLGIAIFVEGALVHSSLTQLDMLDVFRVLTVWGVWANTGNVDGSTLFAHAGRLWMCTDMASGARVPLTMYSDPSVRLESAVLAAVAKDGMVIARLLVSQHPEIPGSGHLDPYGMLAMESRLQEFTRKPEVLRATRQWARRYMESFLKTTSFFQKTSEHILAPVKTDNKTVWGRLRRIRSSLSLGRRRSASTESMASYKSNQDSENDSHDESDDGRSRRFGDFREEEVLRDAFGGVGSTDHSLALEPELSSSNPFSLEEHVFKATGATMDDIEKLYGIAQS